MKLEEYTRLATLLQEAEKIMLTHERSRGKTKPINKHFDKACNHISEVRSQLEEMMFLEHPKQATTYLFYPGEVKASEKART